MAIESLKSEISKLDTNVTVNEKEVDTKSIVAVLDKIHKEVSRKESIEQIDYTMMLDELMRIIETQPNYNAALSEIKEAISPLVDRTDQVIKVLEKLDKEYPFKFNKDGELIVEQGKQRIFFDHRNQNKDGVYINPLTEETGAAILAAIDGLEVSVGDVDVNTDGLEALQTATNTKLDTLNAKDFSTETTLTSVKNNQTNGTQKTGLVNASQISINPATEETLQSLPDKIPKYDMYITRNGDGTVATKVWKIAGTSTVVKTLTYNRSGGYLVSKIIT